MTVRRVMGIETEYGISVPGDPAANPMILSGQVVNAYASAQGIRAAHASWDYADEAPLRDARGFEMGRSLADPSQLTDEEDPTLANVVLTNGARLYVDHAHPEYSSPEVTSPRAALAFDRAGEAIMAESVRRLSQVPPGVNLYKNNTDGKGQSYGTHENYLMRRETPFTDIVRHLVPFFVARQVVTGSGRVGIGMDSRTAGYQLSQRSDFFEVEVGLETTLKRPIINTRDEPHAVADLYRRLHVIIGDANHCDVANLLKLGMTSLVLAMIEDRAIDVDLTVARPVATLQAVSHDPTCRALLELRDGTKLTAVQLLWRYHGLAERYLTRRYAGELDDDTAEVMRWWAVILDRLERDPMEASRELDWVAKQQVMQGYIERDGLDWSDSRLRAIDIQWSDVRPDRGIFHKLRAAGRFEELVTEETVLEAVHEPPADTRAYFRGKCLEKYPDQIAAASWDSVIFDIPGQPSLQRVPMLEPLRGTKATVGPLLDRSPDAATLLRELASASG
ncbi:MULTISPECIES: depupylase/deamidase Dop [unclassified Phycicoccus]|uniref:depupylase/deamidase Dop n=1 Tax=unclassified Phycicoccus TaxID=2637926 RepID=UPI000703939C|nr:MULTISPECIES: depupylase/deamidase Dop [unclassified Phycicoccus]KRF24949.1 Pup deamidase/depupylase [Phycicoccus sp. Soil803]KRF29893.1 Pup deamidase/depupylase [Phycicoccus sp. Soil802]